MKTLLIAIMLLSGCTTLDAGQRVVAQYGAKVADESLESSLWAVCQGPTIGAWIRRFGNDPQKAEGWRRLCSEQINELPK